MDNIRYVRESELNNNKNEIFSNLNSRHVVLMNKITDFYSNKNNGSKTIKINQVFSATMTAKIVMEVMTLSVVRNAQLVSKTMELSV